MSGQAEKPTVVLIMDGGCVHGVRSNITDLEVVLVDYDTGNQDQETIVTDPDGDEVTVYRPYVDNMSDFVRQILAAEKEKNHE